METISEGRKQPIELVNHNKLVRFYKGCDGLKTGFTNEAKYCISATAVRDNIKIGRASCRGKSVDLGGRRIIKKKKNSTLSHAGHNIKRRGIGDEVVVFFFQAEDGIRDIGVTGVQTCALPI